jgi:polyferredoxin
VGTVTHFPILNEQLRASGRAKKAYVKRLTADTSQPVRRAVQISFLLLNVYLGVQFYLFVRQFETFQSELPYTRPPGIEGWLPIAGLMNLKAAIVTGHVPLIHPAAMVLLTVFLVSSLLLRKAFCGWLCPVGTISEWLWKTGRSTFGRNVALPRWLDIPLRSLKYILLGLFLWVVVTMPVYAIEGFLRSSYGLVADVKILNFFRYMSTTAAIVLGVIVFLSIAIKNFWCRYLCPYGALMGLAALASPLRIRRQPDKCIDCAKCAKVCPSHLPVDRKIQIHSAECLGCLECVAVCPAEGALDLSLLGKRPLGRTRTEPVWVAVVLAVLFLGGVGWAKWSGHWDSPIPQAVYQELIPNANEYDHPR